MRGDRLCEESVPPNAQEPQLDDGTNVREREDTGSSAGARLLAAALAIVGVIVLLNIGAVTVVAVTPERCVECHASTGAERLEVREGHADSACLDCHGGTSTVDTVLFAGRQVYGMHLRLPMPEGRSAAAVSDASCVTCHDVASAVSDRGAIRVDHASCAADRRCTDCHSRVAHGDSVSWPRSYDMFDCVPCHMSQAESVQCDYCHTERSRAERVSTGTFALTHSANWREMHGMGDSLACGACHTADKCVSCHGAGVPHTPAFASGHSDVAVQPDAACDSCHVPAFCSDCHGMPMPHPDGFARGHSSLVKAEGDEECQRCHAPADCVTCHVKHVHPGNAKLAGGDRADD